MAKVRKPAVAGSFYPADKGKLKEMMKSMFDNADYLGIEDIKGVIAPHAGYFYSGNTAAKAYKQLKKNDYNTVVVIGPSHHTLFDGFSVGDFDYFETPLGKLPVDKDFVVAMKDFAKYDITFDIPHMQEHSVEVQLPYLQYILRNDFKIVPIIMGRQVQENIYNLAMNLFEVGKDRNVLIVSSSDLYHGYDYEECVRLDKEFTDLLLTMETDRISRYVEDKEFSQTPVACGAGPILSNMITCKMSGYNTIKLMDLTNSVDATKQNTGGYVVGYSSFVIFR
ncbi:MAG: AmmeMemoRadiSam system protein B [Proteobacteria bacterium]|nr:AmmeMemoRadiSam system protein B [Pseudomonadota bacterium]